MSNLRSLVGLRETAASTTVLETLKTETSYIRLVQILRDDSYFVVRLVFTLHSIMKKKTKVSGIIKICVLITSVILASSFLLFLLTNATDNPGDQLATQSPAISQPQTNIEPTISQNSQLKVNKDDISLKKELALPVIEKPKPVQTKGDKIHFIHIPKCGGTTMTTLLRQIQCTADPEGNSDCCLNPGFCDWHAHRRCSTIMGCINHFPNRYFKFEQLLIESHLSS